MKRPGKIQTFLYFAVTASFLLPILYLLIRILFRSPGESDASAGYHSDADYILMLFQCLLGLITINLPTILERRLRFELPGVLYGFYIVFLYCAIFLGEVRSFFYLVPGWDVILHCCSSIMTGFFGMMVVTILNRDENVAISLSPFFVALFAFSFAVMIGTVWEVFEFTVDGLLGVNMQKFINSEGVTLAGRAALTDTMKDIVVDIVGAGLASLIGYFSIRHNRRWFVPVLTDAAPKRGRKTKVIQ